MSCPAGVRREHWFIRSLMVLPRAAVLVLASRTGERMQLLLVGDDWAEDHHDVELMDEAGRTLARARLPEGAGGMGRLDAVSGEEVGGGGETAEVRVGIETDRGLWVAGLVGAGLAVVGVEAAQESR